MDDSGPSDVWKNRPGLMLEINEQIRRRSLPNEAASSASSQLDFLLSQLIRMERDLSWKPLDIEKKRQEMADIVDDVEGPINNHIRETVTLSQKCKNLTKVKATLHKNPEKELKRLGLGHLILTSTPIPVLLDVDEEFRIKKEASGSGDHVSLETASEKRTSQTLDKWLGVEEREDDIEVVASFKQNGNKRNGRKNPQGKGRRNNKSQEDNEDEVMEVDKPVGFVSAKEAEIEARYQRMNQSKNLLPQNSIQPQKPIQISSGASKAFIPPFMQNSSNESTPEDAKYAHILSDERLKGVSQSCAEKIFKEVVDHDPKVTWDDIAGLKVAKKEIEMAVILPILNPAIFTGIRAPGKGVLLFGPPGTGKTMIGKCIASQADATFFSITASALTSKWVGEGEKMVRAMFAVARVMQPSVIFIDEIDSLLLQRNESDHECSTRIKTEFLSSFDGLDSKEDDRLLVVGATNRPQALDEAARRRFTKRLYIPLPDLEARLVIIKNLLKDIKIEMSPEDLNSVAQQTEGFSGADMANLCKEAAMGPLRAAIASGNILGIKPEDLRSVVYSDFQEGLRQVRPSVSPDEIHHYEEFNKKFGATST